MDTGPADHSRAASRVEAALAALPKSYAVQWRPATKALVVQAVEGGWLMLEEALARYRMSLEEYRTWQAEVRQMNLQALKAGRIRALTFGRPGVAEGLIETAPPSDA